MEHAHSKSEMRRLEVMKEAEHKLIRGFVNREILTGVDGGLRRAVKSLFEEYNRLNGQLQMTNSNWPHEKKLHEELASIKDEKARAGKLATECMALANERGREVEKLKAEVDEWKAKYIDARKSGYEEGLEDAREHD